MPEACFASPHEYSLHVAIIIPYSLLRYLMIVCRFRAFVSFLLPIDFLWRARRASGKYSVNEQGEEPIVVCNSWGSRLPYNPRLGSIYSSQFCRTSTIAEKNRCLRPGRPSIIQISTCLLKSLQLFLYSVLAILDHERTRAKTWGNLADRASMPFKVQLKLAQQKHMVR